MPRAIQKVRTLFGLFCVVNLIINSIDYSKTNSGSGISLLIINGFGLFTSIWYDGGQGREGFDV